MEQTISLKNLTFQVLFRWRGITFFAFFLAFLLGGNQGYKQIQALSDPELALALRQSYEDKLFEYTSQKDALDLSLNQHTSQYISSSLYRNESILMSFDPYNVYMGSVEVYIDSYFEILSDSSVQNTDNMGKIIAAYQSKLNYGEMYSAIGQALGSELSMKYMKELVSISTNQGSGTINFTVRMDSYGGVETVTDVIMAFVQECYYTILEEVADHGFIMSKSAVNAWIDDGLNDQQENLDYGIANNLLNIASLEKELVDLEKENPGEYNPPFQVIKLFLIGGFIGGILAVGYIVLKTLFSNKLEEESFLESEFDQVVLAVKPLHRHKGNGLDRRFERMYNNSMLESEDDFFDYLKTSIQNKNKGDFVLHFTGTIEPELISQVYRRVSDEIRENSTTGGFLLQDKTSLANAEKAQAVILVEKRNKTNIHNLDREIKYLQKMGKEIIGVVLL